jgi:hypothetical protein
MPDWVTKLIDSCKIKIYRIIVLVTLSTTDNGVHPSSCILSGSDPSAMSIIHIIIKNRLVKAIFPFQSRLVVVYYSYQKIENASDQHLCSILLANFPCITLPIISIAWLEIDTCHSDSYCVDMTPSASSLCFQSSTQLTSALCLLTVATKNNFWNCLELWIHCSRIVLVKSVALNFLVVYWYT